jgi:uncharacterized protein
MSNLTTSDREQLLSLARLSIQRVVCGEDLPQVDLESLSPALREDGVCFVTLTTYGDLRGCIGGLEATQPLALDVIEHAAAAATEDYRFFPVRPEELTHLHIEISRLTTPVPLEYVDPMDLPGLLHPGVDGVVLRDGFRRSTFLPQVWEKLPDPVMFLNHLCQKMGAPGDLWRRKVLKVEIYHVEEFHEGQE